MMIRAGVKEDVNFKTKEQMAQYFSYNYEVISRVLVK